MALTIVNTCINCWACLPLCPNEAIIEAQPHFRIDARFCTECQDDFAQPQCAAICPVDGAIVDALGAPVNPAAALWGGTDKGVGWSPAP